MRLDSMRRIFIPVFFVTYAAQAAVPDTLRTDTVPGSMLVPLGEAVVDAGWRPVLHERAPWAVSHVAVEELQKRDAAVDVPFVLRFAPSVVVTSDAGTGIGYTGLRVRGSDATRVQVTLNGVPVNDAESHQVYWVNMPDLVGSTDGVQIVRGAGSGAYGPGAFGATVSLGTTALAEEPGGRAVLGGGSFGTWRGTVQASTGRLGAGWYGEFRASHVRSEGWVDRASARLWGAHLSAARVGDRGRVVYTALLGHERTYQSWFGVPRIALDGTEAEIAVWAAGSYEYGYGTDVARIADLIARRSRHNYYSYPDEVDDYRQDHHQLLGEWQVGPWALRGTLNATFGSGYYEQYRAPGEVRQRWLSNRLGGAAPPVGHLRSGAGRLQLHRRPLRSPACDPGRGRTRRPARGVPRDGQEAGGKRLRAGGGDGGAGLGLPRRARGPRSDLWGRWNGQQCAGPRRGRTAHLFQPEGRRGLYAGSVEGVRECGGGPPGAVALGLRGPAGGR